MQIGEVAAQAGVNTQTIRFYERRKLLKKPPRLSSGYRDYPADAVQIVRFIKRYQELGFTLKEIESFFKLLQPNTISAARVRDAIEAKMGYIDERIKRLQEIRDELSARLSTCECRDGRTLCPNVKALANSISNT